MKGGTPDTTPVLQNMVPSSFKNNVTAANTDAGLEYWSVSRFPAESHISANNAFKQVWNGQADGPAEIYLVDSDSHRLGGQRGVGLRRVVHRLQHGRRNAARRNPRLPRRRSLAASAQVYGRFTDTVFQNYAELLVRAGLAAADVDARPP